MSVSTSMRATWGARARARRTAAVMPPATATWLSLISTQSASEARWLRPPPQRTAYFSSSRSPGVVLRVSHTTVSYPAARAT